MSPRPWRIGEGEGALLAEGGGRAGEDLAVPISQGTEGTRIAGPSVCWLLSFPPPAHCPSSFRRPLCCMDLRTADVCELEARASCPRLTGREETRRGALLYQHVKSALVWTPGLVGLSFSRPLPVTASALSKALWLPSCEVPTKSCPFPADQGLGLPHPFTPSVL